MTWRAGAAAAALLAAFVAGWTVHAWRTGAQAADDLRAAQQSLQIELDARAAADKRAAQAEVARLTAEQQSAALARDLEDMANADQTSGGGLPAARVERLRRR